MRRLWVMFEGHRADGQVWAVRAGNTWHRASRLRLVGAFETVYRGRHAHQPRAYLAADGAVGYDMASDTLIVRSKT